MQLEPTQSPSSPIDINRRRHERVPGPFDGFRVGALETPVRIYDLSRGGCFINSLHEQEPGISLVLKIELPYEGWIRLRAETVYRRPGFGFAVRFTEMTNEVADRLQRTIDALKEREPHDE
jgi:PilZ domain-containing protein